MKYKILLLFIMTVCGLTAVAGDGKLFSVNFAKGKWDKSLWTQLRLPHQAKIPQFIQRDNSLGTNTFTKKQKQAKLDIQEGYWMDIRNGSDKFWQEQKAICVVRLSFRCKCLCRI